MRNGLKVLIVGLPKSGTTGLFYLIKNSFEQYYGKSVLGYFEPEYCPEEVKLTKSPAVIKILILPPRVNFDSFENNFDKKIIIIRDPRDRLISDLLYYHGFHNHAMGDKEKFSKVYEILKKKESDPKSISTFEIWQKIEQISGNPSDINSFLYWVKSRQTWLEEYLNNYYDANRDLLYKYEDFVQKRYDVLEKYLGIPIIDKSEVPENLKRVERTKSFGNWRSWFTEKDVEILRPILDTYLDKLGYDASDWKLSENPKIEPSTCSEYFKRVVEESVSRGPIRGYLNQTKKERLYKLFPKVDIIYTPFATNLEFFRIDSVIVDLLNGKLVISGLALPKDTSEFNISFKDEEGIKVAECGLPSPLLGEKYPDKPIAKKARFRVADIIPSPGKSIEVYINMDKIAEIKIQTEKSFKESKEGV
ncbi:Sulfotransferase domain protein [Archaeoglobus fulgidus DSM 8774]|uniref:Sulfotransferase domain protein n=1 Tax=Archaeoglobus fulgidus DSM 8774 TaxID=1344584 RepID=A0A075WC66_ARCFL|nr:hypothetical protein [Archaeoglobus fulgidus]AIG97127.1 Sulfotransferase domain protein [Archaeoglobus fulgidus DSM 8774]